MLLSPSCLNFHIFTYLFFTTRYPMPIVFYFFFINSIMASSSQPRGWFHTAAQSGEVFVNAQPDDLLIRTSVPSQRLLMGPARAGSVSAIQVAADTVTVNSSTIVHGSLFIGFGDDTPGTVYSQAPSAQQSSCLSGRTLVDGAVTTLKVAPGAITGVCLAPGAITSSRLAPGAVGAAALAPLSVGTAALADASITAGKLTPGSVTLAAMTPIFSAPLFDMWTLSPYPTNIMPGATIPVPSPFLYTQVSGRDASNSPFLTLIAAASLPPSTCPYPTTPLMDHVSGTIAFPIDGVYEVTSSLRITCADKGDVTSLSPLPSSCMFPIIWFGSNVVLTPTLRVRLGYCEAVMTPNANVVTSYSGVLRSSYTGVFTAGDAVTVSVSPGGWTPSTATSPGLTYDTTSNASYVSVTLLHPIHIPVT